MFQVLEDASQFEHYCGPACCSFDQSAAADCEEAQNSELHIVSVNGRHQITKGCELKDLLEMQTVASLTCFILIPEDTGKPLAQAVGNLQKLECE